MSSTVSLVAALQDRAQLVASTLAFKMKDPGIWGDYAYGEELVGELRFDNFLHYHRKTQPSAIVVFRNIQMCDIKQVDWGEAKVIESNVVERHRNHFRFNQPLNFKRTLSHTFSKTKSLLEQAKVGAEASIKASVGAEGGMAGVKATLEVSARIYAEYQRHWGESSTQSDTASLEISGVGPVEWEYEAVRSVDKTQRLIRAHTDFTHTVELIDERMGIMPNGRPYFLKQARSWEEFLMTCKGFSASDKTFYHDFIDSPLCEGEMEQLSAPSLGIIEFMVEYDNVLSQDISIL